MRWRSGWWLCGMIVWMSGCTMGRPLVVVSPPGARLAPSGAGLGNLEVPAPLHVLAADQKLLDLVRATDGPVVVDFYADWCGPCQQQGKLLDQMSRQISRAQGLIVKVNIDDHPELADRYQVASLPTLLLFERGEMVDRHDGVADRAAVASWLKL